MSTVLSHWMTLFISVIIMFTPLLSYTDALHREALDTVLHEAAKEASIKGAFTTDVRNKILDTLENDYNFDRDVIDINLSNTTTVPQPRNSYIQIEVTIPRGPMYVIDMLNQGPAEVTRNVTIMSEYLAP